MQQILVAYLLNAAWQISIVAICAFLVSRFAGLSPQGRSRLWLMFLAAAAILPAVPLADLLPHATPTVARLPPNIPVEATVLPASSHVVATPSPAVWLPAWSAWVMIGLVAAVAVLMVVRLLVAGAAARRLVEQSRPALLPPEVIRAIDELARGHRRATPPIRWSADVASPAVVGALNPVILVPEGLEAEADDLRAAMLHEMAHVLRHDYAVNLACELLTLPVAWHPGVIGIKAGVRHSRELACDAIAASAMASQKTYAKCLVSLAQSLGAQSFGARSLGRQPQSSPNAPVNAALAVGLFGRSNLEDRLMQLMKPRDTEGPFIRTARICGLAAVGAGLLGSAALLRVTPVFAQTPPPPAAVAAPATSTEITEINKQIDEDVGPPPAAHGGAHHPRMVVSRKGVIISDGDASHAHSWTSADGRAITVYNGDAGQPSAEQQRQWEEQLRRAEEAGARAEARVNSPEFKARIAAAEAKAAAAEARVNSPEFKARIARAEAQAAAAEARVNSPEFKARIAAAEARAAEAERRVNSPEFKARIERAEAQAVAAEAEGARAEAEGARAQAEGERAQARGLAEAARAQARAQQIMARTQARMAALGERMARHADDEADDLPTP